MESSANRILCGVCSQSFARYTCPRCATHTCSLPCSRSHKSLQSCSGERDKTAYVPLNKYGWGTMVNDYVYLEELGRKIVDWGRDIVKGGLLANAAISTRARGRGRGRGRSARTGGSRAKRDILKLQLDARDIEMEMLPLGMEKRRLNKSTWDVRSRSPLLTIEFVFHAARDPLAPSTTSSPPTFSLLTHRNHLNHTLLDTVQRHVAERGKKESLPSWIQSLASIPQDETDVTPFFLMAQPVDSPSYPNSKECHKLDATRSLAMVLRHKSFVEYPTIDVWEDGAFSGAFVETDGTVIAGEDIPPPAKRRRLDTIGGQKMLKSLLGDYKSEDEEQKDEDNILSMLDKYGSEEEPGCEDDPAQAQELAYEEAHLEEESDEDEHPTLEDLHDILEVARQASTEDQVWSPEEEDDEIEWDDSEEDEAEALERALQRQQAARQAV